MFSIFAVNVGPGSMEATTFLSNIGELLVLLATAVLFVIAILKSEAAAKK